MENDIYQQLTKEVHIIKKLYKDKIKLTNNKNVKLKW